MVDDGLRCLADCSWWLILHTLSMMTFFRLSVGNDQRLREVSSR
nr:MAG TPA_asm: hypothetical protein [Caudoviricetes sp.]